MNQLDPFSIKVLKYLQKHPDSTTDEMRKKFGNSIESLLDELCEEHYVRNRSGEMKDWDNWFIDDKGMNAIKSRAVFQSLSSNEALLITTVGSVLGSLITHFLLNFKHYLQIIQEFLHSFQ